MKKVASAATIKIDARKVEITGTAAISNITGLNNGDVVTIYPAAAFTFATGGNINAAMTAVADAPFQIILREGVVHTLTIATTSGVLPGVWTTPAFDAGDFTASDAMTWGVDAGDITAYSWELTGKRMTVSFRIGATDVGGVASTFLQLKIPNGKVSADEAYNLYYIIDAGAAPVVGRAAVTAGGTTIQLWRLDGAAWTITAADNTTVMGQITFEVQ